MAKTQQPRRCKEHRRQGVRTDPWPGADKILSYMTAVQAMMIARRRKPLLNGSMNLHTGSPRGLVDVAAIHAIQREVWDE